MINSKVYGIIISLNLILKTQDSLMPGEVKFWSWLLSQLIECYLEKKILEKFSPRPTGVHDIGRETIWKFRVPPSYNFAIILP